MATRCEVAGAAVPFRVRAMNFGQHWRTPGIVDVEYRLIVPVRELETFLSRPDWLEEARAVPDDRTPFEQELARRQWPTIPFIMADPVLVQLLVGELGYDFVLHVADAHADPGAFVLNTVDRTSIEADTVVLEGRGRRRLALFAHQDG